MTARKTSARSRYCGKIGVHQHGLHDVGARPLEHQGIGDHDGGREGWRPPVGAQIDDQGWQVRVEQDVAGQVAVDEMGDAGHRSQSPDQLVQVLGSGMRLGGQLSPRDPVRDGPDVGAVCEERRHRLVLQGDVQPLADRDDLMPATG